VSIAVHHCNSPYATERAQALAATARAAQFGFDESEARLLHSWAYTDMADYGGVIRELTPLVSNPEHRASALRRRADALLEIGDFEQALDDANQAIAALPDEVAYVIRGNEAYSGGPVEL
jgi:tetratricopeptide (TPR) repeat protein